MIDCQRHLFEIPDEIAYLNMAYLSPLLRSVRKAGEEGVARKSRPWDLHLEDFYAEVDEARGVFAELVGTSADNIAVVPAASYGLQIAANNLPVRPGQRIVILADQFPSNVYVWRELAKAKGGEVVTVPRPPDWNWTRTLLDAIDDRVAIAALPNCHWTDGTLVDVGRIGARCREVGAALVLDVTQSLGALAIDVGQAQPDFLVCATYKWLLGPYSLGFAYVAPKWHGGRSLEQSPFSRARSDDPNEWYAGKLTYRDEYQPGARRFDVGERANFALMPMAITAMRQILDWRVSEIAATLTEMTREIAVRAGSLGLVVPEECYRAGHMIGVRFPGEFPAGLNRRLEADQVHVSLRADSLRVSPYLYNTQSDLDRLFDVLAAAL